MRFGGSEEVGAACIYGQTGFTKQDGTVKRRSPILNVWGYLYNGYAATDDSGLIAPFPNRVGTSLGGVDWGCWTTVLAIVRPSHISIWKSCKRFLMKNSRMVPVLADASIAKIGFMECGRKRKVWPRRTGFTWRVVWLFQFFNQLQLFWLFSCWGEDAYMWSTTDGSNGQFSELQLGVSRDRNR